MTQKNQITIGNIATQLLKAGKTADETLGAVKRVFPEAQTTKKCIYFYAHQAGVALQAARVVNKDELAKVIAELKQVKAA